MLKGNSGKLILFCAIDFASLTPLISDRSAHRDIDYNLNFQTDMPRIFICKPVIKHNIRGLWY